MIILPFLPYFRINGQQSSYSQNWIAYETRIPKSGLVLLYEAQKLR